MFITIVSFVLVSNHLHIIDTRDKLNDGLKLSGTKFKNLSQGVDFHIVISIERVSNKNPRYFF